MPHNHLLDFVYFLEDMACHCKISELSFSFDYSVNFYLSWAGAEPSRGGATPPPGCPIAGATHGARAAVVAGLSRSERPGRGCSRDLPPPPRRAGAAPGQDMRNECWTSKNKVVGNPDDGKCLHLFDPGSLQKQ